MFFRVFLCSSVTSKPPDLVKYCVFKCTRYAEGLIFVTGSQIQRTSDHFINSMFLFTSIKEPLEKVSTPVCVVEKLFQAETLLCYTGSSGETVLLVLTMVSY